MLAFRREGPSHGRLRLPVEPGAGRPQAGPSSPSSSISRSRWPAWPACVSRQFAGAGGVRNCQRARAVNSTFKVFIIDLGLKDDPYRSLAGEVERTGGVKKPNDAPPF